MKIQLKEENQVEVKFIKVSAQVRHWEGATVNGESSENGDLVPLRNGGLWEPVIDIDNGVVLDWPEGAVAEICFKVCDAGSYYLLDENKNVIASVEGDYVPSGLCHGGEGYGDYIIMCIGGSGGIVNYRPSINEDDWNDD